MRSSAQCGRARASPQPTSARPTRLVDPPGATFPRQIGGQASYDATYAQCLHDERHRRLLHPKFLLSHHAARRATAAKPGVLSAAQHRRRIVHAKAHTGLSCDRGSRCRRPSSGNAQNHAWCLVYDLKLTDNGVDAISRQPCGARHDGRRSARRHRVLPRIGGEDGIRTHDTP